MRSSSSSSLNRPNTVSKTASTRVILVRHGRSTFNEQGRYQGSSDESVLTEQGQRTANQIGQALKGLRIDAIYASPLQRVKQTIDGILHELGDISEIPIHWTRQLREIDLPQWEGLPFQYVRQQLADDYRCWKERPHEFQMAIVPDSTSPQFPVIDLYKRTSQFWQETLPSHRGQTLLIGSHGGTNHALISTALGLAPDHYHTLQQSNCGISVLEFPSGVLESAEMRSLNLTHPLGETLPKLKEGNQGLRLLLVPVDYGIDQTQLAEQMRSLSFDFCLSSESGSTQGTVHTILQHHPQIVHLHTSCANFPQLWRQAIRNQQKHSPKLITGLVVSDVPAIQDIVGQAIGLSSEQRWRLHLQPGIMSVLHYPAANHHPVLQSLNFGGTILPELIYSPPLNCSLQTRLSEYVSAA